jgi:heptosyltransferase-2
VKDALLAQGTPDKSGAMRFLIVRIAAIGDVAMSTTLLSRIRAEHPDAHVTWLCGNAVRELVALFPGVDEVIAVDETRLLGGNAMTRALALLGVWTRLAGRRFDRVLILHPDRRYRMLALPLLGAHVDSTAHSGPTAHPVRGRYRGDENARLLDGGGSGGAMAMHYEFADLRAAVPPSPMPAATKRRVALVPGGTRNVLRHDARRRWPVASYRVLAQELVKRGIEPVLIGDKHDADMVAEFDGVPVQNWIGRSTLVETAALLRTMDLLVTHDTGPMHVARLVRTPTVALFGPTNPNEFVGEDERITVLWGGAELACRPCYDGIGYPPCADHVCMSGIPVSRVLDAVLARLS